MTFDHESFFGSDHKHKKYICLFWHDECDEHHRFLVQEYLFKIIIITTDILLFIAGAKLKMNYTVHPLNSHNKDVISMQKDAEHAVPFWLTQTITQDSQHPGWCFRWVTVIDNTHIEKKMCVCMRDDRACCYAQFLSGFSVNQRMWALPKITQSSHIKLRNGSVL